jgi:hypothetical protein
MAKLLGRGTSSLLKKSRLTFPLDSRVRGNDENLGYFPRVTPAKAGVYRRTVFFNGRLVVCHT